MGNIMEYISYTTIYLLDLLAAKIIVLFDQLKYFGDFWYFLFKFPNQLLFGSLGFEKKAVEIMIGEVILGSPVTIESLLKSLWAHYGKGLLK